jgi:hypothetical protein
MGTRFDDADGSTDQTAMHKIDELADDLTDLSVTVDEIKEDPGDIDEQKLDEVQGALDRATGVVDEIENDAD